MALREAQRKVLAAQQAQGAQPPPLIATDCLRLPALGSPLIATDCHRRRRRPRRRRPNGPQVTSIGSNSMQVLTTAPFPHRPHRYT